MIDAWHSKKMSPEKKTEILQQKIEEINGRIKQLKSVRKLLEQGIEDVREGLC